LCKTKIAEGSNHGVGMVHKVLNSCDYFEMYRPLHENCQNLFKS